MKFSGVARGWKVLGSDCPLSEFVISLIGIDSTMALSTQGALTSQKIWLNLEIKRSIHHREIQFDITIVSRLLTSTHDLAKRRQYMSIHIVQGQSCNPGLVSKSESTHLLLLEDIIRKSY